MRTARFYKEKKGDVDIVRQKYKIPEDFETGLQKKAVSSGECSWVE